MPTDNKHLHDPAGLGASTGEDVELQPSPAYQATYMPEGAPVKTDNRPLYETAGLGVSTGEDMELQPCPA